MQIFDNRLVILLIPCLITFTFVVTKEFLCETFDVKVINPTHYISDVWRNERFFLRKTLEIIYTV